MADFVTPLSVRTLANRAGDVTYGSELVAKYSELLEKRSVPYEQMCLVLVPEPEDENQQTVLRGNPIYAWREKIPMQFRGMNSLYASSGFVLPGLVYTAFEGSGLAESILRQRAHVVTILEKHHQKVRDEALATKKPRARAIAPLPPKYKRGLLVYNAGAGEVGLHAVHRYRYDFVVMFIGMAQLDNATLRVYNDRYANITRKLKAVDAKPETNADVYVVMQQANNLPQNLNQVARSIIGRNAGTNNIVLDLWIQEPGALLRTQTRADPGTDLSLVQMHEDAVAAADQLQAQLQSIRSNIFSTLYSVIVVGPESTRDVTDAARSTLPNGAVRNAPLNAFAFTRSNRFYRWPNPERIEHSSVDAKLADAAKAIAAIRREEVNQDEETADDATDYVLYYLGAVREALALKYMQADNSQGERYQQPAVPLSRAVERIVAVLEEIVSEQGDLFVQSFRAPVHIALTTHQDSPFQEDDKATRDALKSMYDVGVGRQNYATAQSKARGCVMLLADAVARQTRSTYQAVKESQTNPDAWSGYSVRVYENSAAVLERAHSSDGGRATAPSKLRMKAWGARLQLILNMLQTMVAARFYGELRFLFPMPYTNKSLVVYGVESIASELETISSSEILPHSERGRQDFWSLPLMYNEAYNHTFNSDTEGLMFRSLRSGVYWSKLLSKYVKDAFSNDSQIVAAVPQNEADSNHEPPVLAPEAFLSLIDAAIDRSTPNLMIAILDDGAVVHAETCLRSGLCNIIPDVQPNITMGPRFLKMLTSLFCVTQSSLGLARLEAYLSSYKDVLYHARTIADDGYAFVGNKDVRFIEALDSIVQRQWLNVNSRALAQEFFTSLLFKSDNALWRESGFSALPFERRLQLLVSNDKARAESFGQNTVDDFKSDFAHQLKDTQLVLFVNNHGWTLERSLMFLRVTSEVFDTLASSCDTEAEQNDMRAHLSRSRVIFQCDLSLYGDEFNALVRNVSVDAMLIQFLQQAGVHNMQRLLKVNLPSEVIDFFARALYVRQDKLGKDPGRHKGPKRSAEYWTDTERSFFGDARVYYKETALSLLQKRPEVAGVFAFFSRDVPRSELERTPATTVQLGKRPRSETPSPTKSPDVVSATRTSAPPATPVTPLNPNNPRTVSEAVTPSNRRPKKRVRRVSPESPEERPNIFGDILGPAPKASSAQGSPEKQSLVIQTTDRVIELSDGEGDEEQEDDLDYGGAPTPSPPRKQASPKDMSVASPSASSVTSMSPSPDKTVVSDPYGVKRFNSSTEDFISFHRSLDVTFNTGNTPLLLHGVNVTVNNLVIHAIALLPPQFNLPPSAYLDGGHGTGSWLLPGPIVMTQIPMLSKPFSPAEKRVVLGRVFFDRPGELGDDEFVDEDTPLIRNMEVEFIEPYLNSQVDDESFEVDFLYPKDFADEIRKLLTSRDAVALFSQLSDRARDGLALNNKSEPPRPQSMARWRLAGMVEAIHSIMRFESDSTIEAELSYPPDLSGLDKDRMHVHKIKTNDLRNPGESDDESDESSSPPSTPPRLQVVSTPPGLSRSATSSSATESMGPTSPPWSPAQSSPRFPSSPSDKSATLRMDVARSPDTLSYTSERGRPEDFDLYYPESSDGDESFTDEPEKLQAEKLQQASDMLSAKERMNNVLLTTHTAAQLVSDSDSDEEQEVTLVSRGAVPMRTALRQMVASPVSFGNVDQLAAEAEDKSQSKRASPEKEEAEARNMYEQMKDAERYALQDPSASEEFVMKAQQFLNQADSKDAEKTDEALDLIIKAVPFVNILCDGLQQLINPLVSYGNPEEHQDEVERRKGLLTSLQSSIVRWGFPDPRNAKEMQSPTSETSSAPARREFQNQQLVQVANLLDQIGEFNDGSASSTSTSADPVTPKKTRSRSTAKKILIRGAQSRSLSDTLFYATTPDKASTAYTPIKKRTFTNEFGKKVVLSPIKKQTANIYDKIMALRIKLGKIQEDVVCVPREQLVQLEDGESIEIGKLLQEIVGPFTGSDSELQTNLNIDPKTEAVKAVKDLAQQAATMLLIELPKFATRDEKKKPFEAVQKIRIELNDPKKLPAALNRAAKAIEKETEQRLKAADKEYVSGLEKMKKRLETWYDAKIQKLQIDIKRLPDASDIADFDSGEKREYYESELKKFQNLARKLGQNAALALRGAEDRLLAAYKTQIENDVAYSLTHLDTLRGHMETLETDMDNRGAMYLQELFDAVHALNHKAGVDIVNPRLIAGLERAINAIEAESKNLAKLQLRITKFAQAKLALLKRFASFGEINEARNEVQLELGEWLGYDTQETNAQYAQVKAAWESACQMVAASQQTLPRGLVLRLVKDPDAREDFTQDAYEDDEEELQSDSPFKTSDFASMFPMLDAVEGLSGASPKTLDIYLTERRHDVVGKYNFERQAFTGALLQQLDEDATNINHATEKQIDFAKLEELLQQAGAMVEEEPEETTEEQAQPAAKTAKAPRTVQRADKVLNKIVESLAGGSKILTPSQVSTRALELLDFRRNYMTTKSDRSTVLSAEMSADNYPQRWGTDKDGRRARTMYAAWKLCTDALRIDRLEVPALGVSLIDRVAIYAIVHDITYLVDYADFLKNLSESDATIFQYLGGFKNVESDILQQWDLVHQNVFQFDKWMFGEDIAKWIAFQTNTIDGANIVDGEKLTLEDADELLAKLKRRPNGTALLKILSKMVESRATLNDTITPVDTLEMMQSTRAVAKLTNSFKALVNNFVVNNKDIDKDSRDEAGRYKVSDEFKEALRKVVMERKDSKRSQDAEKIDLSPIFGNQQVPMKLRVEMASQYAKAQKTMAYRKFVAEMQERAHDGLQKLVVLAARGYFRSFEQKEQAIPERALAVQNTQLNSAEAAKARAAASAIELGIDMRNNKVAEWVATELINTSIDPEDPYMTMSMSIAKVTSVAQKMTPLVALNIVTKVIQFLSPSVIGSEQIENVLRTSDDTPAYTISSFALIMLRDLDLDDSLSDAVGYVLETIVLEGWNRTTVQVLEYLDTQMAYAQALFVHSIVQTAYNTDHGAASVRSKLKAEARKTLTEFVKGIIEPETAKIAYRFVKDVVLGSMYSAALWLDRGRTGEDALFSELHPSILSANQDLLRFRVGKPVSLRKTGTTAEQDKQYQTMRDNITRILTSIRRISPLGEDEELEEGEQLVEQIEHSVKMLMRQMNNPRGGVADWVLNANDRTNDRAALQAIREYDMDTRYHTDYVESEEEKRNRSSFMMQREAKEPVPRATFLSEIPDRMRLVSTKLFAQREAAAVEVSKELYLDFKKQVRRAIKSLKSEAGDPSADFTSEQIQARMGKPVFSPETDKQLIEGDEEVTTGFKLRRITPDDSVRRVVDLNESSDDDAPDRNDPRRMRKQDDDNDDDEDEQDLEDYENPPDDAEDEQAEKMLSDDKQAHADYLQQLRAPLTFDEEDVRTPTRETRAVARTIQQIALSPGSRDKLPNHLLVMLPVVSPDGRVDVQQTQRHASRSLDTDERLSLIGIQTECIKMLAKRYFDAGRSNIHKTAFNYVDLPMTLRKYSSLAQSPSAPRSRIMENMYVLNSIVRMSGDYERAQKTAIFKTLDMLGNLIDSVKVYSQTRGDPAVFIEPDVPEKDAFEAISIDRNLFDLARNTGFVSTTLRIVPSKIFSNRVGLVANDQFRAGNRIAQYYGFAVTPETNPVEFGKILEEEESNGPDNSIFVHNTAKNAFAIRAFFNENPQEINVPLGAVANVLNKNNMEDIRGITSNAKYVVRDASQFLVYVRATRDIAIGEEIIVEPYFPPKPTEQSAGAAPRRINPRIFRTALGKESQRRLTPRFLGPSTGSE